MAEAKRIAAEISAGDLIDKVTILEIKSAHFTDPEQLRNVRRELESLQRTRDETMDPTAELAELTGRLRAINEELWQIEDAIRLCENRGDFGPKFVELARSVYRTNDRRSAVKRQINQRVGSRLVEEKGYTAY